MPRYAHCKSSGKSSLDVRRTEEEIERGRTHRESNVLVAQTDLQLLLPHAVWLWPVLVVLPVAQATERSSKGGLVNPGENHGARRKISTA